MTEFQRIIKAVAIAFAIFLVVVIIGSIFSALSVFGFVADGLNNKGDKATGINYDETFQAKEIQSLNIDNAVGNVTVIADPSMTDSVKVTGSNVLESFSCNLQSDGNLKITNSDWEFFNWDFSVFDNEDGKVKNNSSHIEVLVPEKFAVEKLDVSNGVGEMNVEGITAEHFTVDGGVGKTTCKDTNAERVKIEGGVGSLTFKNVVFNDLSLDIGTGDVNLSGILTGDSDFDCGVGKAELELTGKVEDYDFDVDPGLGSIYVNGDKMEETNHTNKSAENAISIDGGVGSIDITIQE